MNKTGARMKAIHAWFMVAGVLAGAGAVRAGDAADVKLGDGIAQVVETLGVPQGKLKTGNKTTYYYEQGMVDFVDGRVVKSGLLSPREAAAAQAQREQEEAERHARSAAGRQRLTEAGASELQRLLGDRELASRSGADRVAFWKDFAVRYPYTDVSRPLSEATAAADKEAADKAKTEKVEAIRKRFQEIADRNKQLDADYAASLANWKRNEIEAERRQLREERAQLAEALLGLGEK
jgi:FixJ family two-component response regulator